MEEKMISVDKWTAEAQAYFLTHMHSDHTRGLSSTWSRAPLFCSPTSAKLIPFKFPGFDLSLLRVLDIAAWYSLSLSSPSSGDPATLDVIAIDALHCPGAVMFLFRGDFGHVLYTGDFRWETTGEKAQNARHMLLNALDGASVDAVYLDNTYCNPYYSFPPREVAAQQVIEIITAHPEHDIVIGIDSLGKEDLLLQISQSLKTKIWVWPERLKTMHLLGYPDVFTTNTSLTRIRAIPRYSFRCDTLEGLNAMRPTIGIMPSGLPWVVKPLQAKVRHSGTSLAVASTSGVNHTTLGAKIDRNMKSVEKIHQHIYSVPYSDHSCFPEIKSFVELIQPSNLKGIVSMSPLYVDPRYYLSDLLGSSQVSRFKGLNLGNKQPGAQHRQKMKRRESTGIKKKSPDVNVFGVRIRRVSILRRTRRGAKIMESDDPD